MYKVTIVGTGQIAIQKHIPAWLKERHEARVVALCDVNRESGEKAAGRFSIPKVYEDAGEMIEKEKPDIVDICTPPKTHAPLAVDALKAGAHVMLEKPMALDTEECDRIIAAAEETGRRVCVTHSDLFYQSFMKAREAVRKGLGRGRGSETSPNTWASRPPSFMRGQSMCPATAPRGRGGR